MPQKAPEEQGQITCIGSGPILKSVLNIYRVTDTETAAGVEPLPLRLYVLLDCRPSLGMLVINALSAADYVLIPVQADYLAAEDMTELIGTVQSIKRRINPKLKIGGVFLTMTNETNFRKDIVASVKENFGKHMPVIDTIIPATVRLAEISTADKSIFLHDPKGRAAEAYRNLVQEVMNIGEKQRVKSADLSR